MNHVTQILNAIEQGRTQATDELLPLVYEELRHLAAQKLSHERPGQTLQPTALVHEAYIRLIGSDSHSWDSRGHFFAAAAEAMRRILVDNARRKRSLKRGGSHQRVELDDQAASQDDQSTVDMIALDEALDKFTRQDKAKAELVKLRYFAGLTGKQAAEVLGISPSTADEHWAYARAWLRLEIEGGTVGREGNKEKGRPEEDG